jgi:hypothetical protein
MEFKTMNGQTVIEKRVRKGKFNPFRLVSDEEYGANLNAIIAYYQIAKGEAKKRLASNRSSAS